MIRGSPYTIMVKFWEKNVMVYSQRPSEDQWKLHKQYLSSSSAFLIFSGKLMRAWFVEYPLLKQNWWENKSFFIWRKFVKRVSIHFSKILLMLANREIGLSLLQSSLSPFLWMGITFAVLSRFGNTPWLKEIYYIT